MRLREITLPCILGVTFVWNHSWGYGPSSIIGLLFIVLLVRVLMGRI
ncbi:MAG: DUF3309 family protein [Sulfuriferula sp.]